MNVSGLGVLAVGLVLCFYGRRSLQIAVLASGFALGWLVAEGLGARILTTVVVAIVAALAAWAVSRVVFGAAVFFVGALAGGVVGASSSACCSRVRGASCSRCCSSPPWPSWPV